MATMRALRYPQRPPQELTMANRSLFERVRESRLRVHDGRDRVSPYRAGGHLHCVASSEPPLVTRQDTEAISCHAKD